jgi:hypothetical protein
VLCVDKQKDAGAHKTVSVASSSKRREKMTQTTADRRTGGEASMQQMEQKRKSSFIPKMIPFRSYVDAWRGACVYEDETCFPVEHVFDGTRQPPTYLSEHEAVVEVKWRQVRMEHAGEPEKKPSVREFLFGNDADDREREEQQARKQQRKQLNRQRRAEDKKY